MFNNLTKGAVIAALSFSVLSFAYSQKSEVVIPKINKKISRAAFLRDKLPEDALFYARIPSQFGIAFSQKNKASDTIISSSANEKIVLHLKKLLQDPVLVNEALSSLGIDVSMDVDFGALTKLIYTSINGPIEIVGIDPNKAISPATNTIGVIPLDLQSTTELEKAISAILKSDIPLSFTNNFLQIAPFVSLYFDEKAQYLYVSIGMSAQNEEQLKSTVTALKSMKLHKMYDYENQLDLTGQNFFVWADVMGNRDMVAMLTKRDAPFMAEYIQNTEGIAYGVGTNSGKLGQARLISKTNTDKITWLQGDTVAPDFKTVGAPKNIGIFSLPSKRTLSAFLVANTSFSQDLDSINQEALVNTGFDLLGVLDIVGPQVIGYEDDTGTNLAIGIRDKQAFDVMVNNIKKNKLASYQVHKGVHELKIKNPLLGLMAKEARQVSLSDLAMRQYAVVQPLLTETVSAFYGLRAMDANIYLYWSDEKDWIVLNTLPYSLAERNKAKHSLANWFNEQGIQSQDIVLGFNTTIKGAEEKWYRDYLKFLRNNYDLLGQKFDLFSMPAPSSVKFNPTSRIGFHVSKNSEWVMVSLDYDISPFYTFSLIGGQMNSIGAVGAVGILSMFALPAYQDYTKRTYVAEGMALATAAKMAATEVYATEGIWPSNNQEAGLPEGRMIAGHAVSSIEVLPDAEIVITYNSKVQPDGFIKIKGKNIYNGGSVLWGCSDTNLSMRMLPASCRSQMLSNQ